MKNQQEYHVTVADTDASVRLDLFISTQFPQYSRTFIQQLISNNYITVHNKASKASTIVKPGDEITIIIPRPEPLYTSHPDPERKAALEKIPVEIVYEHPDFYIINKPAGLTTHKPSLTSTTLTLVDWLVLYMQGLLEVGNPERPGIVHRLDKDTSGLLIVARNNVAHHHLSALFKERKINKTYSALVHGHPPAAGSITVPIGRDPITRNKMAANGIHARSAVTDFKALRFGPEHALLEIYPRTGRTHQIRVHMSFIGHPLVGDQLYGKKSLHIQRHALHAQRLQFDYHGQAIDVSVHPPADFTTAMETLL